MENKPSVVMMGLGYIGLPTAALIASKGLKVTGVDIRQGVVDTINKGQIHIVEPDLEGLVHKVVKDKNLCASIKPVPSDVYLVAVPRLLKEITSLIYLMFCQRQKASFRRLKKAL